MDQIDDINIQDEEDGNIQLPQFLVEGSGQPGKQTPKRHPRLNQKIVSYQNTQKISEKSEEQSETDS